MPDSTATPLPDPNANQPGLSVLPNPAEPKRTRGKFSRRDATLISEAKEICVAAKKPQYAAALTLKKVPPAFVTGLEDLITQAGGHTEAAVNADENRMGDTREKSDARQDLIQNLQSIQAAARLEFLPEQPEKLHVYGTTEDLDASKPVLEQSSQAMINKATQERPGNLDTAFIVETQAKRDKFVSKDGEQSAEVSKGKQERRSLKSMLRTIVARRKKIQYAADLLWPHYQTGSAQARSDFKLPLDRPYTY